MKILLSVLLLMMSHSVWSATLPTNKNDYCARFNNPDAVRTFSIEPANLMNFKNQGGLFNGGVCWWHSRFQRNIFYLAIFRPDLRPLEKREVRNLIKEIRLGKTVVQIPGFHHFADFSHAYQKEIQAELEAWQLYDGVVLGSWIDGLQGDTHLEPAKLKHSLDVVYDYVENKQKIAYQKLQIKGITSHSWLVIGMKSGANGYDVGFVDSNNPRMTESYSYKNGEDSFFIKGYGNFVPYLGFTREEERLTTVARSFCGQNLSLNTPEEQWENDYALDLQEARESLP